jgi:LacI family transcriptional regulator
MASRVSVKDVARAAGVSVGTVSNVLNQPAVVSSRTRERVLAAIADLGFVRNEPARQLRAGASRTLGLVVLDVANPFFTDVAHGVEEAAGQAGLTVLLCNSDQEPAREARHLELLEEQRVRGILVTPVAGAESQIAQIRARGIPVVLLDRISSSPAECSVGVNDVVGGYQAVLHLLDAGHRRIAFIGGPPGPQQVRDRHDGAVQAVRRAGLPEDVLTLIGTSALTFACGREAGAALAAMPARDRPTAAFCANDLLALGLLQEMTLRQIPVPAGMAIVGYDDIDFAGAAAIPLSSVRQPRHELGLTAARLLIEEATRGSEHRHRQVIFEPELVVRASSVGTADGDGAVPPGA